MFKQLNTNDLKATNGGIIPVIIWAFAYDRSRTAEARRQVEHLLLCELVKAPPDELHLQLIAGLNFLESHHASTISTCSIRAEKASQRTRQVNPGKGNPYAYSSAAESK